MKIIRVTTFLDYGGIERKMVNTSTWHDENDWLYIAINKGERQKTIFVKMGRRSSVLICLIKYRV